MAVQPEAMQSKMLGYFAAERYESLVFIVIGLSAIAVSYQLVRSGSEFRSMAVPLVAIAIIQLVVGATVFLRTDAQVAALSDQLRLDPGAYRAAEVARMVKVMANFKVYKAIEIALLGTGIVLAAGFSSKTALWAGAIGMIIQSAAMLVLDLLAERRGRAYLETVHEMIAP